MNDEELLIHAQQIVDIGDGETEPLRYLGAATYLSNERRGLEPTLFLELIAKAHCELSEAAEAWMLRAEHGLSWTDAARDNKPEGVGAEFADVILTLAAKAFELGIDLDAALAAKNAYNQRRGPSGKKL